MFLNRLFLTFVDVDGLVGVVGRPHQPPPRLLERAQVPDHLFAAHEDVPGRGRKGGGRGRKGGGGEGCVCGQFCSTLSSSQQMQKMQHNSSAEWTP